MGLFNQQQRPMNFWDALGQGLMGGYQKGQEQKEGAAMYGDLATQMNNINNTDFGTQTRLIDQASRDNPNSNYMGKNVEAKALAGIKQQGLFPSTDFLGGQQVTSDNIGKGLFGSPQASAPNTALQYTPDNSDTSSAAQNPSQQPNFTSTLAKDNPDNPYSKANNPSKWETTMPMTVSQAKSHLYAQIPSAMKELVGKYGMQAAKEIMPMLQQATNDRLGAYQQEYNQQQLSGLKESFNQETNPMKRAMLSAQMKQYGMEVDPKMISALSPDYQMVTEDYGGVKRYGLVNKKDPSDYRKISEGSVVNTPYQNGQLGIADRNATTNARNADTKVVDSETKRIIANKPPRGNNPNGKTATGLNYAQYEKANGRYQEILSDLWDSKTPQERAMKANSYTDELNTIGRMLDKDVNNDVNYIIGGG